MCPYSGARGVSLSVGFPFTPLLPVDISTWLHSSFLGNTVGQYFTCGVILFAGLVFKRFISRLLNTLAYRLMHERMKAVSEEEFQALLVKPVDRLLLAISLYLAFNVLAYPLDPNDLGGQEPWPKLLLFHMWQFFLIWTAATVVLRLLDFAALVFLKRNDAHVTSMDNQLILFAKDFVRVLIWFAVGLIILSTVFKYDVGGFLAGLGIGGLALAFAAKESLENLLASFTIFLDRPFTVGELITVGDLTGTVEKIGFRSTRVRTGEKSYVTMPNKMMIDRPLNNLSRRPSRRVRFDLNLSYDTTPRQLEIILQQLTNFISRQPKVDPESVLVRFNALSAAAKVVYVEYFIVTESYTEYMDVVQVVNFEITRTVARVGAAFANINGAELQAPTDATTTDDAPVRGNTEPASGAIAG